MSAKTKLAGNILGDVRAETDYRMLSCAFIETPDYLALSTTDAFNFVVGRRGTGKSALYLKIAEKLLLDKSVRLYTESAKEYEVLDLNSSLEVLADSYRSGRSIMRVVWRVCLLMAVLDDIAGHYKFGRCDDSEYLISYCKKHKDIIKLPIFKKCSYILTNCIIPSMPFNQIPGSLANLFDIENLQGAVHGALSELKKSVAFLFDNLDEGWLPRPVDSAILGGLCAATADFRDSMSPFRIILFVRDNVFRALSVYDQDFSRHIEGYTLRLRWDTLSLLHLVASRLRIAFGLSDIENDVKVWNRFAKNELANREGFRKCLYNTLFRPRDLLVLLNAALIIASRTGRREVILDDIDAASKQISTDRLHDLLKEYDIVFPGLELLVAFFKGRQAVSCYGDIVDSLERGVAESRFIDKKESDFALLSSGREAFFALFSIGFLGLEDVSTNNYIFCHDGSSGNLDATSNLQRVCIHPCYWKALEIKVEDLEDIPLEEIHDDIKNVMNPEIEDFRMKRVGQLISELPSMPLGNEGATSFERWVLRVVQMLFAGKVINPELKPNKDAVQRRDVVATIMANGGFWERVRQDYDTRQIVFEVKNFKELGPDEFRQAQSYLSGDYGRFIIIINRSDNEGLNTVERGWVKETWDGQKKLIMPIPASMLARCVSKLRKTSEKFDYTEQQLNKRLDTFVRSYLSLRHK